MSELLPFIEAGISAFLVGMAVVVLAIVLSSGDQPRPSIGASLKEDDNGTTFIAKVKAHGLRADRRVQILVQGILPPRRTASGSLLLNKDGPIFDRTPLYGSVLGPDASGDVDSDIELPVARGFDSIQIRAWIGDRTPTNCFKTVKRKEAPPGCVTVRVPGSSGLPQLTTTWERSAAGTDLVVHATAHGMALSVVDSNRQPTNEANFQPVFLPRPTFLHLRVTAIPRQGPHKVAPVLFSALLAPDDRGSIDETVRLPVAARFSAVCVAAHPLPPPGEEAAAGPITQPTKEACGSPLQAKIQDTSTVWTRLAVPATPVAVDPPRR